jgi:hypothetical protein
VWEMGHEVGEWDGVRNAACGMRNAELGGRSRLVKVDQGGVKAGGEFQRDGPPSPPSESATAAAHSKNASAWRGWSRPVKVIKAGRRLGQEPPRHLRFAARSARGCRRDANNDGRDARAPHAVATACSNFEAFSGVGQGSRLAVPLAGTSRRQTEFGPLAHSKPRLRIVKSDETKPILQRRGVWKCVRLSPGGVGGWRRSRGGFRPNVRQVRDRQMFHFC